MDSGCPHVMVVVAGFLAYRYWCISRLTRSVEVGDAEDVELVHDGSAVCVAVLFGNESDESLLHPYQWL